MLAVTSARTSGARLLRLLAVLAAAALSLSGCSGGGSTSQPSASTSPSAASSAVGGVALTAPGTKLEFGQSATVAYRVRGQVSTLELRVESASKGSVKDLAGFALDDPYKKRGSYYYVRVSVANRGTGTTGGFPVPLWGISGQNTLLQPVSFTTRFAPCPTKDLPRTLAPGADFATCLVFLSPNRGSLEGVSYRPTESFVPIEWRGKVKPANASQGKKGQSKKGQGKKGSKGAQAKKGNNR